MEMKHDPDVEYIIPIPTNEDAEAFVQFLQDNTPINWNGVEHLVGTNWVIFKEDTIYKIVRDRMWIGSIPHHSINTTIEEFMALYDKICAELDMSGLEDLI